MQRLALSVCLAFVLLAAHCAETTPTKNPATKPQKPPPEDDGFDLSDALGGEDEPTQPQHPADHPGDHGNTGGGFNDADLFDGPLPSEKPQGDASESAPEGGMLAGIISSVVVAVVGAVSSFIAYQKKKLCFKASDQENVNMESQQGAHSEPPVQRTLLQKS